MVLVKQNDSEFKKLVDELILFSEFDPELADGIKWLDTTEKYNPNLNFYERVWYIMLKKENSDKAKEWLAEKQNNLRVDS